MPLTDFLKSFLQKLPENIQYLGTDVAPLMGPNWQQAMQAEQERQLRLAAGEQQQANWEKQFGAQQQHARTQEDIEQGKLFSDYIRSGWMPQQAPENRGLQGAGPSFGAGGGVTASPETPIGADPSITSLAPWLSMFNSGQQGVSGQAINGAGNQPGAVGPSNRMPGAAGASEAGGVILPAMSIPGLPGTPMIPPPPTRIQPLPDEVADFFKLPHGVQLPVQQFTLMMDTYARVKERQVKEPTQLLDVQAQMRMLDPTYHGTPEQAAIEKPDLFNKAKTGIWEREHPDVIAAREATLAAQRDKLQLSKDEQANGRSLLDRTLMNGMAWGMGKEDDKEHEAAKKIAREEGLPIPTAKLDDKEQQRVTAAYRMQGANDYLKNLAFQIMKRDPSGQAFSAMMGKWDEKKAEWGIAPRMDDPELSKLIAQFVDGSNNLVIQEGAVQGGGRIAIQLLHMLKGIAPSVGQNPSVLTGSFRNNEFQVKNTLEQAQRFIWGVPDPKKPYPGAIVRDPQGNIHHYLRTNKDGSTDTID